METTKKIFFRGTEEDSWRWKQVAAQRKTTLDAMLREAAEMYIQIPESGLAEARAWIAERFRNRKKGDGAQAISRRAVIVQSEQEAQFVEKMLEAYRANKQPVASILAAIAEAA